MSIPSSRYQRNANEKETRILRLWQSAISPADAFYAQMTEGVLRAIKWVIAEKINASAGNDGRLSSCDEKIYDYYKKLMYYYDNILRIFDNNSRALSIVRAHRSGEILNGVRAVVASRAKSFDESRARDNSSDRSEDETTGLGLDGNPVKIEKNMIISRSIRNFSETFDIAAYRCKSEIYSECFHASRQFFIQPPGKPGVAAPEGGINYIYDKMLGILKDNSFAKFYELYAESARAATNSLNDFYERHAAAFYNEQLLNEHEILRNIAVVQVPVLESEATLMPLDARDAAAGIVRSLMEAYQSLSKDVSEIQAFLKDSPQVQYEAEDYAGFAGSVEDAAAESFRQLAFDDVREVFAGRLEVMREAFSRELTAMADAWLQAGNFEKEAKRDAGVLWSGVVKMTGDIRDVFADMCGYYDSGGELYEDISPDGLISKGIAETVGIKVQSLSECIETFDTELKMLIEGMVLPEATGEKAGNVETLVADAFSGLISELSGYLKEDRRAALAVKKYLSFRQDNDAYTEYIERLLRPVSKNAEAIAKKILKFKKEHVLYEISTFEEIQNYSVSRLRTSNQPHIQEFVKVLDEGNEKLAEILRDNGIELLRPDAHDMFNGREHEVLMAEKIDGFKKGEIIKLMNSGYKQGDTIILRANVIASK